MDALSDVLKSVHLEGAVYLNAEFTAPWCVRGELGFASVRKRLAGAEHVAFFHFLTEGECKVRLVDSKEMLEAKAGDLILLPQEGKHLLGTDLHLAPMEGDALITPPPSADADLFHMRHGGGGAATRFVCGYLALSRTVFRPVFEVLPPAMVIHLGDGPAAALLRELFRAGVRDAHVGKALGLLHGAPEKSWTVDELAKEVALSRSALAERFASLVGEPPMQYLTRWRLALAAQMLRAGREPVIRVAERAGYESEAAFGRAFKREFGVPPASWRKS